MNFRFLLNSIPLLLSLFLLNKCNQPDVNENLSVSAVINLNDVYQVKEGSIYDGDTLRVISRDGEELKIRFACIDAPEKKQKFGIESRDYLRSLIKRSNNKVTLNIISTDRYNRKVAVLYLLSGEAVQTLQVKNGWVYPYPQYKSDCPIWDDIEKAEAIAINNKSNLYNKNNLPKPWEWRKNNK